MVRDGKQRNKAEHLFGGLVLKAETHLKINIKMKEKKNKKTKKKK